MMRKQGVVVVLLLAASCVLAKARDDFFPGQIVPFQPITAEEYNAILDLSNGRPMISEARLIGSGLTAIKGIASNIKNGALTALNLTGLEPIYSSLFKPNNRVQGYPLCVIRTNRLSSRNPRSFNTDSDSNSDGSFSINFLHPSVDDDNDGDDDDADDEDPEYQHHSRPPRPSRRPTRRTTTTSRTTDPDDGSDGTAPVVNCVVVLKRPSSSKTTTTTTTTTRDPNSHYHHYPPPHYQYPHYPPQPHTTTTTTTTTTRRPHNSTHPHYPHYPHYPPNSHSPHLHYPLFPYPFIPFPYPYGGGGWPHSHNPGHLRNDNSQNSQNWSPGQWPWPGDLKGGSADSSDSTGSDPENSENSWDSRKSDTNDEDKLIHHYFGSGAKSNLYKSPPYDAPEIDDDFDIDADVGDVIDALKTVPKTQVRRFRKNHLKVFPAIKDDQ